MASTYTCTPCCTPYTDTNCCAEQIPLTLYITITGFKVNGMTPTDYTFAIANNTGDGITGDWQVGQSSTFAVNVSPCSGSGYFLTADLGCESLGGGLYGWILQVILRTPGGTDECLLYFDNPTVTCEPFYLEAGTFNAGLSDNDCCGGNTFDYTAITVSA